MEVVDVVTSWHPLQAEVPWINNEEMKKKKKKNQNQNQNQNVHRFFSRDIGPRE